MFREIALWLTPAGAFVAVALLAYVATVRIGVMAERPEGPVSERNAWVAELPGPEAIRG